MALAPPELVSSVPFAAEVATMVSVPVAAPDSMASNDTAKARMNPFDAMATAGAQSPPPMGTAPRHWRWAGFSAVHGD